MQRKSIKKKGGKTTSLGHLGGASKVRRGPAMNGAASPRRPDEPNCPAVQDRDGPDVNACRSHRAGPDAGTSQQARSDEEPNHFLIHGLE
jgi:hypothetical protein